MAQDKEQTTNQPELPHTDYYYREDEISLTSFVEVLVNRRVTVIVSTTLFTILSIFYALSLTPVYVASIGFREPPETFISLLSPKLVQDLPRAIIRDHKGTVIQDKPSPFKMYLEVLESYELQRQVYEDGNFLKKFHDDDSTVDMKNVVLQAQNSMSLISEEADETLTYLQRPVYLEMTGSKPKAMAEFIDALSIKAKEHVIKEIKDSISLRIKNAITETSRSIDSLYLSRTEEIANKISLYTEALRISKKLGIKNNNFDKLKNDHLQLAIDSSMDSNSITSGILKSETDAKSTVNIMNNSLPIWYLYGENALQEELLAFKKRSNEDIIPGLYEAKSSLQKYKSIDLDSLNIGIVVITKPSIPPTRPIQPKKRIILSVGMALGLSLGVFIAFVRNSLVLLKKRRVTSTSA